MNPGRRNAMDEELRQLEAEMGDDLRDVRQSATVYAERAWSRGGAVRPVRSVKGTPWAAWGLSAAAAAVLIAGGARLVHHASPDTPAADSRGIAASRDRGTAAVSDEALLEQIQGDLSSGVPAAMQPLQSSDTLGANTRTTLQSE